MSDDYFEKFPAFIHSDLLYLEKLIKKTKSGRYAISLRATKGRLVASLVQFDKEGNHLNVEEFTSIADNTKEEMIRIMKQILKKFKEREKKNGI